MAKTKNSSEKSEKINNSVALSDRLDIHEDYDLNMFKENSEMFKHFSNMFSIVNEIQRNNLNLIKIAFAIALCSLLLSITNIMLSLS